MYLRFTVGDVSCHLPQGRCGLKSLLGLLLSHPMHVTFRKEGVDWNNHHHHLLHTMQKVTFRKEGVDWNLSDTFTLRALSRHLPQGRCGLKLNSSLKIGYSSRSPSARKVWIEMPKFLYLLSNKGVTFRKEGVDWNLGHSPFDICMLRHLPQGRCGLKLQVKLILFLRA